MAIYVTSDIHGDYKKYIQIFDKINFTDDDTLYVLGDVVDRGTGSIKILLDMMCRFNVIPIIGNHEYMAYYVLSKLVEEITEETLANFNEDFLVGMLSWTNENGGENTLKEFQELSLENRQAILEYLEEFTPYEEIRVNGTDYILVHSGLGNFKENKPLDSYTIDEMIWARADYNKIYYKNKILITGHTPVSVILNDISADKILKQNNHIAIDCGCGYGKNLGVLCLDTMKEIYI